MTVPPYAVATAAIGLTAWASARYNKRGLFIMIAGGVAILGVFSPIYLLISQLNGIRRRIHSLVGN